MKAQEEKGQGSEHPFAPGMSDRGLEVRPGREGSGGSSAISPCRPAMAFARPRLCHQRRPSAQS